MRRLLTIVAAIALLVVSCGGNEPLTNDAGISENPTPDPEPTAPPAPTPTTATQVDPTPTPAQVAPPTGTGTIDDPLLIEGSILDYTESFSDASWKAELHGIVETEVSRFNDDDGRCLVLVGVLTPTALDGGIVARGFTTPKFGVIADGALVESSVGDCAVDDLEALGYGWYADAKVTVGTDFPFYAEVFVAGTPAPTVEVVVAGELPNGDVSYYQPSILNGLPNRPRVGPPGSVTAPLLDIRDAAVAHRSFSGDEWDARLFGLVELETRRSESTTSRCIGLLGVLTPTLIEDGTVSSSFSSPGISMIIDGLSVLGGSAGCDSTPLAALGYSPQHEAVVTLGTPFPFFTTWLIPDGSDAMALAVGEPSSVDAVYFEPTILDEVIIPEQSDGSTSPDIDQDLATIVGADFTYTGFGGDRWSAALTGYVPLETDPFSTQDGTCTAVVGVLTPTSVNAGSVSSGFTSSRFSLIAQGNLIDETFGACDTGPLEELGYGLRSEANVTPGTDYPFYAAFLVEGDAQVSALIAGNPTSDVALYFDPVLDSAAPPAPVGAIAPLDADRTPLVAAVFEWTDFSGEDSWSIETFGLVESASVDPRRGTECLTLVGAATPLVIAEGAISDPFSAPRFLLVADGRLIETSSAGCEVDAIEDAGYGRMLDAEVTVGTAHRFRLSFEVPEEAELMAVVLGDSTTDDARYFTPLVISAAPQP